MVVYKLIGRQCLDTLDRWIRDMVTVDGQDALRQGESLL